MIAATGNHSHGQNRVSTQFSYFVIEKLEHERRAERFVRCRFFGQGIEVRDEPFIFFALRQQPFIGSPRIFCLVSMVVIMLACVRKWCMPAIMHETRYFKRLSETFPIVVDGFITLALNSFDTVNCLAA